MAQDDFDFNPIDRLFRNADAEVERKRRMTIYVREIKKTYPDIWNKALHSPQVQEMVITEMEYEFITRQIANDGWNASAYMEKTRKSLRDALFRYRDSLMITPKMMARIVVKVEKEVNPFEAMAAAMNTDYTP